MSRRITEAIFAESWKSFFSILLFIATVRSRVKKSAAIFISFSGIVSIPVALFVSRQLIRLSISGGVTSLKKNVSFRKVLFIKFLLYLFYALVAFKISQNTSSLLLPGDIFERFFWVFPLLIPTIMMQCLLNVLASVVSPVVTTSFSTRVISLLLMKP